jgi:hypothetical protein
MRWESGWDIYPGYRDPEGKDVRGRMDGINGINGIEK